MIAENVQGGTTMSDGILSALDNLGSVFLGDSRDDDFQGGNFVRLRDVEAVVAEVLRNPTDEQADAVAAAEYALRMGVSPEGYYRMPKWYREGARDVARRWMAAAVGGDDE